MKSIGFDVQDNKNLVTPFVRSCSNFSPKPFFSGPWLDKEGNPLISLDELFDAYFQCRKNKRRTCNALAFEVDFEQNLIKLWNDIINGTYFPGKSIAFVVTKPVKREVFAADFRDRVVHHLIANKIMDLLESSFIFDSYSCRVGKGTQLGICRVASFIKECSNDFAQDCYILKMDIKSFFMNLDKNILFDKLIKFLKPRYQAPDKELLFDLIRKVIFNQPEQNCYVKGKPSNWDGLPPSKSLFTVAKSKGLPIGNLTSQIFANFYLNCFDHFVKDGCHVKYYGRYVDDFVIVHKDKQFLIDLIPKLKLFLRKERGAVLHPNKIYLQHYSKGVKFIGAVVKPGRTYISNRTKGNFYEKVFALNKAAEKTPEFVKDNAEHFVSSVNSYLGFMKHYKTYNIRKKILTEVVSPLWQKAFSVSESMVKITLNHNLKPNECQQKKLVKQRKNRKRNALKRKKRGINVGKIVSGGLNPFI